ncbi:MAG: hypothetical protein ACP5IJ_01740 [Candidatus Nanoarchaeia archaeon]
MAHIVIKIEEVPKLINKLYRAINRPRICAIDKKQRADFVLISVSQEKINGVAKLCRAHEHRRRLKTIKELLRKTRKP